MYRQSIDKQHNVTSSSPSCSCQGCVDTEGNCGWCVYDFSCTGQSQDCSVAESFVTVSDL